jgi:hypothetical protein
MAGSDPLNDCPHRPIVGSDAWREAFPFGVTRDPSKAPPIDEGPTGNPWLDPGKGLSNDGVDP